MATTYGCTGNSGLWSDSSNWTGGPANTTPGYDSGSEAVLIGGTGSYMITFNTAPILGTTLMTDPNGVWAAFAAAAPPPRSTQLVSPPPGKTKAKLAERMQTAASRSIIS
jgi:hypothetical protein